MLSQKLLGSSKPHAFPTPPGESHRYADCTAARNMDDLIHVISEPKEFPILFWGLLSITIVL